MNTDCQEFLSEFLVFFFSFLQDLFVFDYSGSLWPCTGFSLVAMSRGYSLLVGQAPHCGGRSLQSTGPPRTGFSSAALD